MLGIEVPVVAKFFDDFRVPILTFNDCSTRVYTSILQFYSCLIFAV